MEAYKQALVHDNCLDDIDFDVRTQVLGYKVPGGDNFVDIHMRVGMVFEVDGSLRVRDD